MMEIPADYEDETTETFETLFHVISYGDYDLAQLPELVRAAVRLANGNEAKLLQMRKFLIRTFGEGIGDETRVALNIGGQFGHHMLIVV